MTYLTLLSFLILRLLRYCFLRTLRLKNIFLYVKKLEHASLGLRQDITFIMHGYSMVSACFLPIIPAMILLVTTISTKRSSPDRTHSPTTEKEHFSINTTTSPQNPKTPKPQNPVELLRIYMRRWGLLAIGVFSIGGGRWAE